jgi:hypothetical protein
MRYYRKVYYIGHHHHQEEEADLHIVASGGYAKSRVDDRCLGDRAETEGGKDVRRTK